MALVAVAPVETTPEPPVLSAFSSLLSTLSGLTLTEAEAQKVMEALGHDSWQLASQKGDPVAAVKKQLEEKEKLLAAEQENATTAKNRVKELTKELGAEKSRLVSVETRLSSELSGRQQELMALQARMQASYQEHLMETQQLTGKIQSLQEQLDNCPNAQLARLQQENSILRDALNQATSQSESRQNAEMAKLRQDCVRLSRELSDRTDAHQAEEERRKVLEAKMAAAEEQMAQMQVRAQENERCLQAELERVGAQLQVAMQGTGGLSQQLETVTAELRTSQDSKAELQQQLELAQQQAVALAELQARVAATEAELKEKCAELEALRTQQAPATSETPAPAAEAATEEEQEEEEVVLVDEEQQPEAPAPAAVEADRKSVV